MDKSNDFAPDWDAMAVMVEEQQRMAKRIEELEAMVKAEREACAKVCEEWGAFNNVAADCAAAIRQRNKTELFAGNYAKRRYNLELTGKTG